MAQQNVNIKSATTKPTAASAQNDNPFLSCLPEGTYVRPDGFVTNLSSKHPHDVIRADVVLAAMETSANKGCGQYYEIYEARLMSAAMSYLYRLEAGERPVFWQAAKKRGYTLTREAQEQSQEAYDELWAELQQDY